MNDPDANSRPPSEIETACFETGIKFGSLYHQFAGTPVSPASAGSLEAAMEDAIENQPYCQEVQVRIHRDRLERAIAAQSVAYTELTGEFFDVEMRINAADTDIIAIMEMQDDYPQMEITSIQRPV
ncbi:MAG: uncharacterized protein conserved in archaea [Haloquadratum sp. J07HQX50]|jgi:Uncharacterized protein conserved in archaea|nr:MAG: uncharacterized protein conserved in archaea [Haloquadratum sp. J07HQX50]